MVHQPALMKPSLLVACFFRLSTIHPSGEFRNCGRSGCHSVRAGACDVQRGSGSMSFSWGFGICCSLMDVFFLLVYCQPSCAGFLGGIAMNCLSAGESASAVTK